MNKFLSTYFIIMENKTHGRKFLTYQTSCPVLNEIIKEKKVNPSLVFQRNDSLGLLEPMRTIDINK